MTVTFRAYEPGSDTESAHRVWREVGWAPPSDDRLELLESFLVAGNTTVADVDGEVECLVQWCPGAINYAGESLKLCVITAVTTSWVGRKRGFASRLTADALAAGVESGAAVAALGMFEQGYYDRLGFGTWGYEHMLTFDPRSLRIDVPYRTPLRLTAADGAEMHAAMVGRMQSHGTVVYGPPEILQAEMASLEDLFALGYRTDGRLSHFVAGSAKGDHGPYKVRWLAYETPRQLLELLKLLYELADQVASVWMVEPVQIQFQDLIDQPGRSWMFGRPVEPHPHHEASAWQQMRILDLEACVSKRRWRGDEVGLNLRLTDPVAELAGISWKGIAGDYTVTIGDVSTAVGGHHPDLPILEASVNAFSRLWFGVRPASSLAITDDLDGPPELLAALDEAMCLPTPRSGCDF